MPMPIASRTALAVLAFALALGAQAAPVRTPNVEAELVPRDVRRARRAGDRGAAPQDARGWHTYWQNPGDSGLPTTIEWKLPAGVTAGPIQWPAPHALPAGPLVNYGYEGEVYLPTTLTVAPGVKAGRDLASRRAPSGWSARRRASPRARTSRSRCR
jgi:thiol:disulfide interchange protein DsbD